MAGREEVALSSVLADTKMGQNTAKVGKSLGIIRLLCYLFLLAHTYSYSLRSHNLRLLQFRFSHTRYALRSHLGTRGQRSEFSSAN